MKANIYSSLLLKDKMFYIYKILKLIKNWWRYDIYGGGLAANMQTKIARIPWILKLRSQKRPI